MNQQFVILSHFIYEYDTRYKEKRDLERQEKKKIKLQRKQVILKSIESLEEFKRQKLQLELDYKRELKISIDVTICYFVF